MSSWKFVNEAGLSGRALRLCACLLCALFCLCGLRAPAAAAGPLRIAYAEFWPFHWRDAQGRMNGLFHDILSEALERRMGLETVWEEYPWARCQANVRDGAADAMLTVPTMERSSYARVSGEAFYRKGMHVFTRAGHPRREQILALSSLEDIRAGGFSVITYMGNGWSQMHVEPMGIPVVQTSSLRSVWLMLAEGRGDLVIEWPPAARHELSGLDLENAVVLGRGEVAGMSFHLLVGTSSPYVGILPEFSRVVREMRKDGALDRIAAKYQ